MFIIKIQVLDPRHYLAILTVREALSLGLSPDMGKPWVTLTLRDRLAAAHIFSEISRRYGVNVKKNRILLRFSRILSGETLLLFLCSLKSAVSCVQLTQDAGAFLNFLGQKIFFAVQNCFLDGFPTVPPGSIVGSLLAGALSFAPA